jgi:hypothetical protein
MTSKKLDGIDFAIVDDTFLPDDFIEAPEPRARGLVLKELTIEHGHAWWGERFWEWVWGEPTVHVYYLATAVDGSGKPPSVWPIDQSTADQVTIEVHEGAPYKWTLGEGSPVFIPRVIEGGLAISIIVGISRAGARHWGEILKKISDDMAAKGDLTDLLVKLASPGGFTVDVAFNALGKATGVVADVLELQHDKKKGPFAGLFEPDNSWAGKLEQEGNGVYLKLGEV